MCPREEPLFLTRRDRLEICWQLRGHHLLRDTQCRFGATLQGALGRQAGLYCLKPLLFHPPTPLPQLVSTEWHPNNWRRRSRSGLPPGMSSCGLQEKCFILNIIPKEPISKFPDAVIHAAAGSGTLGSSSGTVRHTVAGAGSLRSQTRTAVPQWKTAGRSAIVGRCVIGPISDQLDSGRRKRAV